MKDFERTQRDFMQHIRNPDSHAFDYGIEDRRLQIYRELFFNNVYGFLENGFPVLYDIIGEKELKRLARRFFSEHDCRSPYFVDISKEFVEYLANDYALQQQDPVFLAELAHYEWMELDVSARKDNIEGLVWQGDPFDKVSMSPLASLVSYPFPVHQIRPDFQPEQPGEHVFLVVFRQIQDEVNFIAVTQATAYILDLIEQHAGLSMNELVEQVSQAMPQVPFEQLSAGVDSTVKQLLEQQILLPK